MILLKLFLILILVALFVFFFTVIRAMQIIQFFFRSFSPKGGMKNESRRSGFNGNGTAQGNDAEAHGYTTTGKHKEKVIGDDEGEYVEFEEIKE